MRVPIPFVLILVILVVLGVWWYGTRGVDFMTPPGEEKLEAVRVAVVASVPQGDQPENAVAVPPPPVVPPPPPAPPKPAMEPGDLTKPPMVHEYRNQVAKGVEYMVELAGFLEKHDHPQRALLAWERLLDTAKPDEKTRAEAMAAVLRLRAVVPEWNKDPRKMVTIVWHAGTSKKSAKMIQPVMEEVARELEHSSSGILKVSVQVTAGRDSKSKNAEVPVAMWFAGLEKKSRSTEVLAFTIKSGADLPRDVRATAEQIIRNAVGGGAAEATAPAQVPGAAGGVVFPGVTRHQWLEFGRYLNQVP